MIDPETVPRAEVATEGAVSLALHLFGPFEVRLHGQPLPRLRSRKGQWVLALLTLRHGGAVDRSWLAGTLWPDSPEEAALASLRSCLKDLRRALGAEAARLHSPAPRLLALDLAGAQADVVAFDAGIAQADARSLEQAIALYRGPLLAEWTEGWVFPERQAREQAYLTALERLAQAAQARGDREAAERHLRRAAAVDPLRETAQRALMQALAAGGNAAAASEVYRELRQRLHRELNAEPDPETQALFQQLRAKARGRSGVRGSEERAQGGSGVSPGKASANGASMAVVDFADPRSLPPDPCHTITFLFTDIEGSTRLWEEYPDAMPEALSRHNELLRRAIEAHDGHLFKTLGDQCCAAFSTAADALTAALAAQRALQDFGLVDKATGTGASDLSALAGNPKSKFQNPKLEVRMALHTGAVEARDGDYLGAPLNRVARLLAAAHGGQILCSLAAAELVREQLPEGAALRDLGVRRLRDLIRPEQIFQVVTPDLPADFPPLRSLEAFPHNLPLQLTRFVGRESQMAEIAQLLTEHRLLTLTGAGGCGKTRLALQVAAELGEQFADGAWFADLAPLVDAALVPQAVAAALGVQEAPARPLVRTILDHLQARQLLLVMDNCEHLIDACAQLAHVLLQSCPQLRMLATSHEPLSVPGEIPYRVPSLSLPPLVPGGKWGVESSGAGRGQPLWAPSTLHSSLSPLTQSEAVRLFIDRAVTALPDFSLSLENAPAVAQVCQRLGGIPLAIELAAAWARMLTPEQINARLDDRFRLLVGGSRTALARHQTLRGLMDWSYDLLTDSERLLLRRLSVFAGGWTLEAAEAVCSDFGFRAPEIQKEDVLGLLARLVDKSLVTYEERGAERRYRQQETVRQYSQQRLRAGGAEGRVPTEGGCWGPGSGGEAEAVLGRHRDYFLTLAEVAEPELQKAAQGEWLERLEREHDNMRAALAWCLKYPPTTAVEIGLRLAGALGLFWYIRGHWAEGREWVARLLTLPASPAARAKALHRAARLAEAQNDLEAAQALASESLAIGRECDDKASIAAALQLLGWLAHRRDDSGAARALQEVSLAIQRELGDQPGIAASLNYLGHAIHDQEGYAAARPLFETSLAIRRELGDRLGSTVPLNGLGQIAYHHGDYAAARALYAESLAIQRELADMRSVPYTLNCLGEVLRCQGDYAGAGAFYEESLALSRQLEFHEGIAGTLTNLGHVAQHQGDDRRAVSLFAESLALWRAPGSERFIALCLAGLAGVAAGAGRPEQAARVLGAAEALLEACGGHMWPADRADYERNVAAARATLGEPAFAAAWAEGRALPLEEAVAYALAADT